MVERCQTGESGGLTTIELTKFGHLREQQRSCARTYSADGSEFLRFVTERLVLCD